MNEFEGTPGPWTAIADGHYLSNSPWMVEHDDGNDCTWAPIHANGVVVALVVAEDNDPEADRILDNNAKLIAAAPKMFAALELISSLHDHEKPSFELAQLMYEAACIARSAMAEATS